ncbi:MAG: hypothetical protein ACM34K_04755 [Bacillota bacterium]
MGLKDKIVSTGIEKLFNSFLSDIGEISAFSIDSKHKAIKLTVALRGETEPLELLIKQYEILGQNDRQYFIIRSLSTSRQWIDIAFNKYLKDLKIEIPAKYDFIVRRAL